MDYAYGSIPLAAVGFLALAPPILLLLGWRSLRAGRPGTADVYATFGAIGSLLLVGFEVVVVAVAWYGLGSPLRIDPAEFLLGAAVLSYPPAVWYFAHLLVAAVRRRGEGRLEWWAKREDPRRRP